MERPETLRMAMNEDEFLETVRRGGRLESAETAQNATEATLHTLGERIGDSQADALADQLPDGPASALVEARPDEAEGFPFEEFLGRVADRADVDEDEALLRSRAVVDALSEAANAGELSDTREQLPREFDLVFETGERMTADEFFDAVRQRADLDSDEAARNATHATLKTLGERITAGEAANFATYLPADLAATFTEKEAEAPEELSAGEFLEQVANRAGVGEDDAERQARAVLETLFEVISDREFANVRNQLPAEFDDLLEGDETGGAAD